MRIDVSSISVSDVPMALRASSGRLLWMRDAKTQMAPLGAAAVVDGEGSSVTSALWTPTNNGVKLSLIDSGYKKKEYDFKVQAKEDRKGGRFVTVGKCAVDLSRYGEGEQKVRIGVPVKREFVGEGDAEELGLVFDLRVVRVKGLAFDEDDEDDDESEEEEVGETAVVAEGAILEDVTTADMDDQDVRAVESENVGEFFVTENDGIGTAVSPMAAKVLPDETSKEGWLPRSNPPERQNSTSLTKTTSLQKSTSVSSDTLLLQSRLSAAEDETREVRRMLEESIDMLEDETVARQEAEEAVHSLEREIDWLEKKAVKDRADWENRMKDSLQKMESTVVLLETLQREKEEMEARMEASNAEVARLKELTDASFVEQKIKTAEEDAKRRADEQAAIETAALKKQIKTMATRLEMAEANGRCDNVAIGVAGASSVAGMTAIHPALAEEGDGRRVDELEEMTKQLSIENQFLKIEIESLRQDAASAKAAATRVEQSSRREAEVYAQRATDYAVQLKESQAACAETERGAAEARSRIILLEDAVERGHLVAAELRQRIALNEMKRGGGAEGEDGGSTSPPSSPTTASPRESRRREMEDVMRLMREAQDSAEARASQLANVTQELQAVSEELTEAKQRAIDAQREADDACRLAMTMEEEAKSLRLELKARDDHLREFDIDELKQGLQGRSQTSSKDAKMLEKSAQAHELAQEASQMAAALTEKLAYSNKEKLDLRSRLDEARQELHKARSENDAELRKRNDALQRELVVSQNRAEVNAIFREEHDRLAIELIEAKIGLAEASEELLVVKRNLWKSEEKGLSFASKLTKLETRFYSVGGRRRRKNKERNSSELEGGAYVSHGLT